MATKLLIDEGNEGLKERAQVDLSRYYAAILAVGDEGAPQPGSTDREIAEFCYRECADLLTSDKTAYADVLEVERIRDVRISKWEFDKKACQQMYLIRMH